MGGYELAHCDRSLTNGLTSINKTNAFDNKSVTINSGTITVTDGGYAQGYHNVTVGNYYNTAAPKDFLVTAGAELRMTVSFNANGETTEIETTDFTDFTDSDAWYTLDGRKLDKKPIKKGMYINNGRKVVIK